MRILVFDNITKRVQCLKGGRNSVKGQASCFPVLYYSRNVRHVGAFASMYIMLTFRVHFVMMIIKRGRLFVQAFDSAGFKNLFQ